jgi:hypothetical protein
MVSQPWLFIADLSDWGASKGQALWNGRRAACTDMRDVHMVDGAGKWVRQNNGRPPAALARQGMVRISANRSMPYQRLASRRFSSGAC